MGDFDTIEFVQLFLLLTAGILMLLNIWLYFNGEEDDTISHVLKSWAFDRYFFITFAWGVLGGHFFLGVKESILGTSLWLPPLLVVVIMALLYYLGVRYRDRWTIQPKHQFALLISGFLFGHFFWSQRLLEELLKVAP
ncbi:hypothetical protein [Croceiramulus getboli]|nr:hypothetical protein P8624_10985 [Flavobacteriaceae bacterium YJPT1-3]